MPSPNVVDVSTTNTFEEWRVKSNEIGTAIGDLHELDDSSTLPYATVIASLKGLIAEEHALTSNLVKLFDVSGTQVFSTS